ncbi:hypothetical protein PI124_g855 [Phytophthora idaei]|nr:hypothetical protein PI125_g760 [Phytophthora idaei]KAG3174169.1 hypothetical protein PI126_g472 [Phytophthora idaei]KAG3254621.1 hypothetical protein PI124_g855 [Phytophthora idaei]
MDSDARDARPHQRPRTNPEGTWCDVPTNGYVPPPGAAAPQQAAP